jgi:hypothetical protein
MNSLDWRERAVAETSLELLYDFRRVQAAFLGLESAPRIVRAIPAFPAGFRAKW